LIPTLTETTFISLLFNHVPFYYEKCTFNMPFSQYISLGLPRDAWHNFQEVQYYERKRKKTITHIGFYKILQRKLDTLSDVNNKEVWDESKTMLFHASADMPATLPPLKLPITDILFTSKVGTITLQALWDTGALHGNYMSQQTYEKLLKEGVCMKISPVKIKILLADGISQCDSTFSCQLPVNFNIESTSHNIDLAFNVINDSTSNIHDVILGWPAITHELNSTFIQLLQSATTYGQLLPTDTMDTSSLNDSFLASVMSSMNAIWQADDELFESALPDKTPVSEEELELRGEDETNYLGDSYEAELTKYATLIDKQITPELLSHPGFREFISNTFIKRCVPREWSGLTDIEPVKMRFRDDMPSYFNNNPIPVAYKMRERFADATKQYIKYLYTTFSDYGWGHPCCLTPKPGGGWRLVVNFNGSAKDGRQGVNAYIEPPFQMRTKAMEALVGFMKKSFKFFGDMDLTRAFHQVVSHPETAKRLGVIFPDGVRIPKFLPEGCTPATSYLSIAMRELLGEFVNEGWLLVLFDNFLIGATDPADFLVKLKRVTAKAEKHQMVFNFAKCHFADNVESFFGMKIKSDGTYSLSKTRTDAIRILLTPTSASDMRSKLGVCNFAGTFVHDFAGLARNLYQTTTAKWNWKEPLDPKLQQEFITLRNACADAIDLSFPDFELPFVLRVDASADYVSSFLMQVRQIPEDQDSIPANLPPDIQKYIKEATITRQVDSREVPSSILSGIVPKPGMKLQYEVIATTSRKLTDIARRWTPQTEEMYAVVDAVKKLSAFLLGGPFILDTDNSNNLNWTSSTDIKTMHWVDYLSHFDIVRKRLLPRSSNLAADALTQVMKNNHPEVQSIHLMQVASWIEQVMQSPTENTQLCTLTASHFLQGIISNAMQDNEQRSAANIAEILVQLQSIPNAVTSLFNSAAIMSDTNESTHINGSLQPKNSKIQSHPLTSYTSL